MTVQFFGRLKYIVREGRDIYLRGTPTVLRLQPKMVERGANDVLEKSVLGYLTPTDNNCVTVPSFKVEKKGALEMTTAPRRGREREYFCERI